MNPVVLSLMMLLSFLRCETANSDSPDSVSGSMEIIQATVPLFTGQENDKVVRLTVQCGKENEAADVVGITIAFTPDSDPGCLTSIAATAYSGSNEWLFGSSAEISETIRIKGLANVSHPVQLFDLSFSVKETAGLLSVLQLKRIDVELSDGSVVSSVPGTAQKYRLASVLRAAGQDHCDTYRIPGLVTTRKGTLIAVYDNRYNNSKDLQEDIDIGMSRSTDGGETWEPMRTILDMGEYGGRTERLNGIGDPCVLYDHHTHTIWVAGLWMSGSAPDQMLWWASKPGLKPEETGQFILTKSTDDGLTWSAPINITDQIKNPSWQLLLQGPGRGITLDDGTLVFPAQFKASLGEKALDGGQYTSHATLVSSTDGGESWQIGSGAKSNTTEAQVVQLTDGSLMLNMRDDRNRKEKGDTNGRAVAITKDLGKTWTVHPSSNAALPEPNCMASLISANPAIGRQARPALFFSNPDNKNERTHMTIKASLDEGLTWPEEYQLELNEAPGYGYSCMTMIDEQTVGIVYEGVKELYFQKIPAAALLGGLTK